MHLTLSSPRAGAGWQSRLACRRVTVTFCDCSSYSANCSRALFWATVVESKVRLFDALARSTCSSHPCPGNQATPSVSLRDRYSIFAIYTITESVNQELKHIATDCTKAAYDVIIFKFLGHRPKLFHRHRRQQKGRGW